MFLTVFALGWSITFDQRRTWKRLVGKVTEIEFGGVVAHVVMRGGDNVIESVITKRSAEEMKLKVGDTVSAVMKEGARSVRMLEKLEVVKLRKSWSHNE